MGVHEFHAARREPVQVGRFVKGAAVAAQIFPAQIVAQDENDVGFLLRGWCRFGECRVWKKGCSESKQVSPNTDARQLL